MPRTTHDNNGKTRRPHALNDSGIDRLLTDDYPVENPAAGDLQPPSEDATAPERPSLRERYELAVEAMRRIEPRGTYESIANAQARLQAVCDIAFAYDLSGYAALHAVTDYSETFPFPGGELNDPFRGEGFDVEEYLRRAERRVERGRALMPTGVKISTSAADGYGRRQVVATLGDNSHADFFDPREDFRVMRFCAAVCDKFNIKWAEEEIHHLVLEHVGGGESTRPVEKYDISELLRKFPQRRPSVVDGLGREGETINFVSYSKAGKSWISCQLALSIAFGLPWLGRFPTSRGRVLVVDNELSKEEIAHRMRVVAEAMVIEPSDLTGLVEIWSLRDNPRSLDELQADFDAIAPGTFRLIVLDAEYKLLPPNVSENDNAAMAQFHGRATTIASRLGALLVLIHHTSKGSQDNKRLTDIGSGAGAQSRAADCHLVVRAHERDGVVVLNAAVRSFPPIEPLALQWEFPLLLPVDGVDPSQLRVEPTAKERRQQENDCKGKEAILEALRQKGPATTRQLRARTGLGSSRLQRLLDLLEHDGGVTATQTTVRGNTANQYALPDSQK